VLHVLLENEYASFITVADLNPPQTRKSLICFTVYRKRNSILVRKKFTLMNTVSGNTFCKKRFMQTCTCLKCNVNYYRFNTKWVVSSYTGTQRTSIPHSVGVVACISQPCNKECNLIRQVETRIDSQQYTIFLMEIVS
jgi:hypothetical protein